MNTHKQTSQIVNSSCALVFDFCTGELLEPLPSARFKRTGQMLGDLGRIANGELVIVTIDEAARRIGCRPKTLYNWIALEKLTEKQGLRRIGRRCRIDWTIFK